MKTIFVTTEEFRRDVAMSKGHKDSKNLELLESFIKSEQPFARLEFSYVDEYKTQEAAYTSISKSIKVFGYSNILLLTIRNKRLYLVRKMMLPDDLKEFFLKSEKNRKE